LLERDNDGVFRPGALFALYAARHEPMAEIERLAEPVLRRIGHATGETVNLAVPHGQSVVQIAQVDSRYMLGASNWVGVDVPAHCSALGKVFYAHGRIPLPVGPLQRRTPRTVSSRQLVGEMRSVLERGYATTRGELEPGLDVVAVPVHGQDGEVVAALSVSGPDVRLANKLDAIGTLLVKEVAALSGLLGHHPGSKGAA
jgi:DNA-binding IclR family transcriptional regulator